MRDMGAAGRLQRIVKLGRIVVGVQVIEKLLILGHRDLVLIDVKGRQRQLLAILEDKVPGRDLDHLGGVIVGCGPQELKPDHTGKGEEKQDEADHCPDDHHLLALACVLHRPDCRLILRTQFERVDGDDFRFNGLDRLKQGRP